MSNSPELTLADTTLTLAAATEGTAFNLNLSQFERVTVALKNTGGSNDVTAATWQRGADTLVANDPAIAAELVSNLAVGETALVELAGDDVPSQLKCTLTSTSGTTVAVLIKATNKASALFPE
jgi:hypothetical protein